MNQHINQHIKENDMNNKSNIPFTPVGTVLGLLGTAAIACLVNFFYALKDHFSPVCVVISLLFMVVWAMQCYSAGLNLCRGVGILVVGYWAVGFLLHFAIPLAEATGINGFADFAFIGLLMLYVPLYGILCLAGMFHIDYVLLYPVLFLVVAGAFLFAWRKGAALRADQELMDSMVVELPQEEAPQVAAPEEAAAQPPQAPEEHV